MSWSLHFKIRQRSRSPNGVALLPFQGSANAPSVPFLFHIGMPGSYGHDRERPYDDSISSPGTERKTGEVCRQKV